MSRKAYDEKFKRHVAQFYMTNNLSLAKAARTFGVTGGMLHMWLKKYPAESRPAGSNEKKVIILRQEVDTIKQDLAVLKKIVSESLVARALL
jgi:transposase-like protein